MQERNANPGHGCGFVDLSEDDDATQGDEEARLRSWLDGFLSQPGLDLPRPPPAALEILELSHKPTARLEDLGSLLEREPLLAGRVLRLANSALYGATTPVTTLKMALIRMGLSTLRDVVMEAAFHLTVIRAEGFSDTLERIRRHSTAVAWLSRFIARNTSIDAENAFLIGLLHDVGLSVGLVGLAAFCTQARARPVLTPQRWLAVDAVHAGFSERVLRSWGLPPSVLLVAKHHHSLCVNGLPHPNIAILMIAEHIAHAAGWSATPTLPQPELDLAVVPGREAGCADVDRALQAVQLTRKHYELFVADTRRVLDTLRSQFHER